MIDNCTIFDFDGKKIRAVWNAEQNKYYFAVTDIVQVLTDCDNVRQYIKQIRTNDSELDSKWSSICHKVGMLPADGKLPQIESSDLDGILRIMEAIPSEKKEFVRCKLFKVSKKRFNQKSALEYVKSKLKAKIVVSYILKVCLLALVPIFMLILQENNPNFQLWGLKDLDNLSAFHDLYKEDTCCTVDTTVLFLDVSSNMLAVQSPNDSSVIGITVNHKLLFDFLQKAKDANYKAIFIDTSFDESLMKKDDIKQLDSLLNIMETDPLKVFIVLDDGFDLPPQISNNYSAWGGLDPNDFGVLVRSNYIYDYNNLGYSKNSIAFRLYRSINNPNFILTKSTLFPFYYYDNHIFRNNPIVKIRHPHEDFEISDMSLSSFLEQDTVSIKDSLSNKLVFIGDLKSRYDQHYTYAEKLSGLYMIYCEYKTMEQRQFIISNWMLVKLYFMYCLITVILMFNGFSVGFQWLAEIIERSIDKYKNVFLNNTYIKKANIVFFAIIDVFIRFFIVLLFLYATTSYLYNNYDFLYSSTLPKYWFTIIEVLAVYHYNVNHRNARLNSCQS